LRRREERMGGREENEKVKKGRERGAIFYK
jgi:hypothetical protein